MRHARVIVTHYGGPETLRVVEEECPEPGDGEVRVRVITDDQVNAVAHQLYCPICQNVSLDSCPTQACTQWRELIRQKLSEGWSQTQINDYFARQYGSQVLAEPPPQGFNILIYALPPLLLLIVLFAAWRVLYHMQTPVPPSTLDDPDGHNFDQNDPYLAQMEEALRRHRQE